MVFIFMHLAETFIQSDILHSRFIFDYLLSLGIEPMTFPWSTVWATGMVYISKYRGNTTWLSAVSTITLKTPDIPKKAKRQREKINRWCVYKAGSISSSSGERCDINPAEVFLLWIREETSHRQTINYRGKPSQNNRAPDLLEKTLKNTPDVPRLWSPEEYCLSLCFCTESDGRSETKSHLFSCKWTSMRKSKRMTSSAMKTWGFFLLSASSVRDDSCIYAFIHSPDALIQTKRFTRTSPWRESIKPETEISNKTSLFNSKDPWKITRTNPEWH